MLCDLLKVPITLRRSRVRRLAWHGGGAWWHDDRGIRMAFGNDAIDIVSVIGAVASKRSDRTRDLIEQRGDLRTVVDIVGGQFRSHDLASAGVYANVQLAPRTSRSRAVLLDQPLAAAAQFQTLLSTSKCTGSAPQRGRGSTCKVSARLLSVE